MEKTRYTYLQEPTTSDKERIDAEWDRLAESWEALRRLAIDPPFRLRASMHQSPSIYLYDPTPEQVEEAQTEAKVWIRRMASHCRAHGYQLKKLTNSYSFGFSIEGTNLEFSVPTELSCTLVPLLDDDGMPVMEKVTEYRNVEIEVERVRTEKKCITLVAPEDF